MNRVIRLKKGCLHFNLDKEKKREKINKVSDFLDKDINIITGAFITTTRTGRDPTQHTTTCS